MKIAVISTRPPSIDSGADTRNYYIQKLLSHKYDVRSYVPQFSKTLCTNESGLLPILTRINYLISGKIPYIEILKHAYFTKEDLKDLKSADVIQLQEMNAFYLFEKYMEDFQGKIVLDTHNIDYLRFLSETDNKGAIEKIVGRVLSLKIKQQEISAIKKVNHIIVCSKIEKSYFSKYVSSNNISVIPNGVDIKKFSISNQTEGNTILFMGLLSYPPNAKGLKYYIEKVHPIVVKKISDAKLIIIGKGASKWLEDKARDDTSINLVGFVPDVREYIKKAKVCICPIFSGSGTRLKILEYLAMEKPVVSTVKGAEGLKVVNNKNILITDLPTEFANSIIKLINDKDLNVRISINGRKLVECEYDWKKISKKINFLIYRLN